MNFAWDFLPVQTYFFLEKWSALNLRGCFVKNSAFSFSTEEKQQKIH